MSAIRKNLCDIQTVSSLTGASPEEIYGQVDAGVYLWVWNISTGLLGKRQLRFWSREVEDAGKVRRWSLRQVIDELVPGSRPRRQWEMKILLRVSDPLIVRYRDELQTYEDKGRIYMPRTAVAKFFEKRWLGAPSPFATPPGLTRILKSAK